MLSYRLLDPPLPSGNIPCSYFAALQGCIVHPSMPLISKNTFKMSFLACFTGIIEYHGSLLVPLAIFIRRRKERRTSRCIFKTKENITYTHHFVQVFDVDKFLRLDEKWSKFILCQGLEV
jgi:hypothetical protein